MSWEKANCHRGNESGHVFQETLLYVIMFCGALVGFGFAVAKGWTGNRDVGGMVSVFSALIGACAGLVIYGLARLFMRQ